MIARPLRKSLSNKIILVEMLFLAEGGGTDMLPSTLSL